MASSLLTSITSSPPSHQTSSQDEGGFHQVTIPIVQFSGCSALHLGDSSVMHLCSLVTFVTNKPQWLLTLVTVHY